MNDPNVVSPGILGFLAFFFLAVALYLLLRNMNGHLRRMRYRAEQLEAEQLEAEQLEAERLEAEQTQTDARDAAGTPAPPDAQPETDAAEDSPDDQQPPRR
jgi:hypothetical protein